MDIRVLVTLFDGSKMVISVDANNALDIVKRYLNNSNIQYTNIQIA